MVDGHHLAVDLGAYAPAAYVCMYLECEIKRCGTGRQVDDLTLWREHENLRCKKIHFQSFHEFSRIVEFLLPFQSLTQPRQLHIFVILLARIVAFLIFPVSRDTIFSNSMHFIGPDLYLKRLTVITQHSRMKRLVHVWLRHGYIILETSWYRFPHGMDLSQHGVTVAYILHDYSDGGKIEYLIQLLVL